MTLWPAAELQAATGGAMPVPFDATGVSIDTRTLQPGDLFIALQGDTDGHAHAQAALDRGAAGVLVHSLDGIAGGAPTLLVADTLAALTALGRAARERFQGQVVAVTGSVGKTTTKDMLRTALSVFGPTHAAQASYNNHWGVPLTLARLPPDARFCVVEIGMNTSGEILPLALLARPNVSVITAVASAHIGRMGSMEAIADEKATLLAALEPGGIAVLPMDSEHFERLREPLAPHRSAIGFGTSQAASVHVLPDQPLRVVIDGAEIAVPLSAPGAHMASNAAAALAAVHALGLDPVSAAAALADFAPGPGRGQQRRIGDGQVLLLDESYNASAASVRAALAVLGTIPATRRIAVLGDMLELGDFADREHAGLASDVARAADLLYACGPLTRSLFDQVPPAQRGAHAKDAEALAPIVAAAVRPGDAVLVKGSLGSRMRIVVAALEAASFEGPG